MAINKKFILIIILIALPIFSYAEEEIAYFDENWAVNLSGMFNIMSFGEEAGSYTSERPWALGIGLRYKNTSASFSLPLYFNSDERLFDSFDVQFTSYNENIYYEVFGKRYKGFTKGDGSDKNRDTDIDLTIFSAGITAGWLLNGVNHSLSAVYDLDRKQLNSNGSIILGFGLFYTSIESNEEKIERYNIHQPFIYFGPNLGYSYTFVFTNGLFLNMKLIIGLDAGINIDTVKWLFVPLAMPKMSFGKHFNTWSLNVTGGCIYTAFLLDANTVNTLMTAKIAINFTKRF